MRKSSHARVNALIHEIRKQWIRRALFQGSALTLLTGLLVATALLLLYTNVPLAPWMLWGLIALGVGLVLWVLVRYAIRPALQPLTDQQVALYIEEQLPGLEDRLNSAVEAGTDPEAKTKHGLVIQSLFQDAAQKIRSVPVSTVVDRRRERGLVWTAAALLLCFLFYGYTTLDRIDYDASKLSVATLVTPAQAYMQVDPGSVEIEKGESQEILVTLKDQTDDPLVLHYQFEGAGWQQIEMRPGMEGNAFLHAFQDIQTPISYFVEHEDHRSAPFDITLYEFPDVGQIDVTYTYPAYTGLPARTETDTGDIRGLAGSTVTVTVQTTGNVEQAELLLNETTSLPLKALGEGQYQGQMTLQDEGYYAVHLKDQQNKANKFPETYQILPVEDELPYITITDPQRDVRVNALDEVLVAVSVQDDFGLKDARMRFSVNGAEEQTIPLMTAPEETPPTEVNGEHLFFLEDYALEPGDVISYYVEATDLLHTETPEATDMYFIEVLPFDQQFTQANNGGMQGGPQPSAIVLSQQQIIEATWKLYREKRKMDPAEFDENLSALIRAQANLRTNIQERINSTAFSLELQASEDSRVVVGHLRDAVAEMKVAEQDLEAGALQKALTPERKALTHLLRADAQNRERQVAMNRQNGGGSASATEERMTELMDLELDIAKDKYETQQQQSGGNANQPEMDEAMRKIQELARKQEDLANQSRQAQPKGEDQKRTVDRLKRDQDELRRQTEQLADQMRQAARDNPARARQMEESLRRIAENMKQAERDLREEDTQQAQAQQQQALNELQRLADSLRRKGQDGVRQDLEQLAEHFDRMKREEEDLGESIRQAEHNAEARGGLDEETKKRLQTQRQNLQQQLEALEQQAQDLEAGSQQQQPDIANKARNLRQQMNREELDEQMRQSEAALEQGWLDYARALEEDIQRSMGRMERQVRDLAQGLPRTPEEELADALDEVRQLMQQMQDLQAQAETAQQGQQPGAQNQQGESDPSEQGQQGQQGQQGGTPNNQANPSNQAEVRRMQRQLDRAREALTQLQRDLRNNPVAQQQLQQLESALTRADNTGILLKGEAAKAFFSNEVFSSLSQLEMELARQLDLTQMDKKLFGGRKGDVPSAYRDLVEKYYESLAKTKN